jgi:hypothetical protein
LKNVKQIFGNFSKFFFGQEQSFLRLEVFLFREGFIGFSKVFLYFSHWEGGPISLKQIFGNFSKFFFGQEQSFLRLEVFLFREGFIGFSKVFLYFSHWEGGPISLHWNRAC